MTKVRAFLRATAAATSIEYALIAGIVSIAIVLGATSIGTKLNARFAAVANNLS